MSYGLYIAKVVGAAANGDDRLQVRVLPQMSDEETIPNKSCPRWPYFFREEFFTGTGAADEFVWVICNDDFTIGYILGIANFNTYISDNSLFKEKSIPTDLKDIASQVVVNLRAEKLEFTNIKVTFWNNDSIHFIERSTGSSIIAFRNGSIYMFGPNLLVVSLGNSKFTMNANGISFSGASIKLDSGDVTLGNRADARVLVTTGVSGEAARASESAWA